MIQVSVVIPVYNGGAAFRRCLDAMDESWHLCCKDANFGCELIVVDDGSADDSAALAAAHGARVLHTAQPRSGPATARNLGAAAASGDVLFFIDADVAVRPETVGLVAQVFAADPALDALFGSYDDQPGESNFLSQYKNLFHHYVHQHSGEQAASFWSGCGAMRRDVFLRHGGFDTTLYDRPCIEDIELGYRVTRAGGRIRLVKTLQVKHLKRWTIGSLLRSDILDRGIPWTRLLLRDGDFSHDLNLQTHNRVSVAAVWLLALALLGGWFLPVLWLIALGAAVLLLALNWPLYRWFAGKRGWVFTLAVIPWHWLYYFYNGISFAAGTVLSLERHRPKSLPRAVVWGTALAILLGAWALRMLRLDFQDIWWDEARNIMVARGALATIAANGELDIHPPLYFYALHVWTSLAGVSAFATRLLSAGFGVLVVALTFALARSLSARRRGALAGLLAMLLAAVSPFALAEAQETRMYTMTWALLAAAMLALWWALGSEKRRVLPWGAFAVLCAAALATHYGAAIVLATWAMWLLVWALVSPQRWRRLGTLVLVGLATLVLLAPLTPVMMRQIPGYTNANLQLPSLVAYLGDLARAFTLGEYAPGLSGDGGRWLWLALLVFGAVVGLLVSLDGTARSRWDRISLLVLWLVGGLAVYYTILVRRSAFDPRYISFVLVPLWALAGWALSNLDSLARPAPWLAAGALILLTVPSLRADLTDPNNFREDMSGVVTWLQERATPEDVILVDQRYPFGFFWERWSSNAFGDLPATPTDEAPAQYLFVDVNKIAERLTTLAGEARNVFWVTWFESDNDPGAVVPAILDANGELLGSQDFRGYTVTEWRLDPPLTFQLPNNVQPLDLRFEPGIVLAEGDWLGRQAPVSRTHPTIVALRWQADQPTGRPLKVSLRLKDASGATVSQTDRVLLNDRHLRTNAWPPATTALGLYSLPLADVPPGVYDLSVVLYDEESLAPVGLSDGSGVEPVLGTLRVAE